MVTRLGLFSLLPIRYAVGTARQRPRKGPTVRLPVRYRIALYENRTFNGGLSRRRWLAEGCRLQRYVPQIGAKKEPNCACQLHDWATLSAMLLTNKTI